MNGVAGGPRDGVTRGPWMTPAQARQLAAAGDLYHQLCDADLARDADPDPARPRAGWRLDVEAGGLHSAVEELLDTADELTRLAALRTDACPVPWGVCPEHGATPRSTAGSCWCTAPGCLRRWEHDRLGEPCAEPVTHRVDADGDELDLCDGHAIDPRAASSALQLLRGSDGRRHRSSIAAGAGHRCHDHDQAPTRVSGDIRGLSAQGRIGDS